MTQRALELERIVVDLETGVRGYLLTDDTRFLEPYTAGAEDRRRADELERLSPPRVRAAVERIERDLNDYIADYTEPLIREAPTTVLAATTEGKERLDDLRAAVRRPQPRPAAGSRPTRRADAQALRQRMVVLAAGGAVVSVLLLVLLGICLHRFVLLPVRRVARAAERLAHGHLDTRVPATGLGEIGQLGESFNTMAAALAAREEDLRVQTDRLQAILDHTTTTISVKDRDGRYLLVNDEWRRAMGQVGVDVHRPHRRRALPARHRRRDPRHRPRDPAQRRGRASSSATPPPAAAPSTSSSSRSRTPTARSTPPARWAPTSASASARWPRPSRPRARSPSSWPT